VATTWVYSDWLTYERGDATRLSRLRLHMKELSDELAKIQQYTTGGGFGVQRSTSEVAVYLAKLQQLEVEETKILAAASGNRVGWSRARTPQ
jgi:hypothetical protein